MALGQEWGLVLPIFAHAGVVKMLQHMWKEWGRGRACSWLKERGKKKELCLKQKIPPKQNPPCGCGGKGEEQSRVVLGQEQPHVGPSWPGSGLGAHCELCLPLSPLVLLGTAFGCPLAICAGEKPF